MSKGLSVVIPVYNASNWLEPTTKCIAAALYKAGYKKNNAELIIVNDGSTDESSRSAHELSAQYPIKVIDQENSGRFLARKTGLEHATYDQVLFIDSRVFIDEKSLEFVGAQVKSHPDRLVWNGHVNVAKKGNIIARFGDAITFIGWRRYFSNPRTCSYGTKDFDHYPKGTGCFMVPKIILARAVKEFELQTNDIKNSSDDTHLIRIIARDNRINLSPEFSCIYHARTTLNQFFGHSYKRGQFFVDGFLRPGNRFFVPLIVFLFGSFFAVVAFLLFPDVRNIMAMGLAASWLGELVAAIVLKVSAKDALSLFLLSPLFAAAYGAGIWRAVLKQVFVKFTQKEEKS